MIARTPPKTVRYEPDPLWERTIEFRHLEARLLQEPGASLPGTLTDQQRVAVEAAVAEKRWPDLRRDDYRIAMEKAVNDTRLRVAAPLFNARTDDLCDAWLQPEGRELWRRIIHGQRVRRDAIPGLQFAFGVMLLVGGMRSTPHISAAYDQLLENPKLMGLVSELAMGCEGVFKQAPSPKGYAQVTRMLPRLSEGGLAAEVQIMMGEIAVTYRSMGIDAGRFLAVDGSATPAWAQQRSGKINGVLDPKLEARLRRPAPEAGFKAYTHELPRSSAAGSKRITVIDRSWRGYMLTCLLDVKTNLVLAFDLRDASQAHEPRVLRDILLPQLYDHSPQLPVTAIVGDAGYDDNETHEYMATHYGIQLVAARPKEKLARGGHMFTVDEHPTIKAIRGDGVAICRAHSAELRYVGLDAPLRTGLEPGQPTNPAAFRSRFDCPQGCGKLSFPTRRCWSALPRYPRTASGRLDLYALRRALLNSRNQVESMFAATQVGNKQCLDGAARTRVQSRSVQEAFFGMSVATRALLTLTAERNSSNGRI